jgi:hypothetical protein
MAETVIYPLSEETGQRILAALLRIARALEGDDAPTALIEDDMLVLSNASIDDDGYLVTDGAISEDYLEF